MERLTEKIGNTNCVKGCGSNCKYGFQHCRTEDWENCKTIDDVIDKLAQYEESEEQGLLLRLPCKNWMDIVFGEQETFFGIDESYIENPIREITVDSADRFTWYDGWKTLVLKGADENGLDWEFSPEDFGKTVFLTKSEAEAKLKELRGGENE